MAKVFIKTYGCQMNERDSEQVARDAGRARLRADRTARPGRRRPAQHLQRARHGGAKGHRQDGHAGQAARKQPASVFGFLGCMAQSRGASTARRIAARRSRRRHAEISRVGRLRGRALPPAAGEVPALDEARVFASSMSTEETGSQNTIRDHLLAAGRSRLLSRSCRAATCIAPSASCRSTRGAERGRADRGNRRRSARAGGARREGSHAARADRESLRPPRICEAATARARSCSCSRRLREWPGSSAVALHFAASDRLPRGSDRGFRRIAEAGGARPSAAANRAPTGS